MGSANCATVLQPLPISHHFHGCTALLVLRFVIVKWRYIKYLALPFYTWLYTLITRSVEWDVKLYTLITTLYFYVSGCSSVSEMYGSPNCVCSILGGASFGLDRNPPSVRVEIFQEKDIPDGCIPVSGVFEVSNGKPKLFAFSQRTGVLSAQFNSIQLKNFQRPQERSKNDELVTEMKYAFIFYTTATVFDSAVNLQVSGNRWSVCKNHSYTLKIILIFTN